MVLAGAYAQLTGLLKSDLATIEIELSAALRGLERGDIAQARRIVAKAHANAMEAQQREACLEPVKCRPTIVPGCER